MFERIVVPLDGSDLAGAILTQIRRILFFKDAEILLVRAVQVLPSLEGVSVELPEILKGQASKYLEQTGRVLADQGVRVRTVVRIGEASQVILDVAGEERASLIAMSTHGRSGFARFALGSVAERILRTSRIPVLVVRSFSGTGKEALPIGPTELSFKRILVPIDAADLSLEVVSPALNLAKLFGSHVVLLHVWDGGTVTIPIPQLTAAYEEMHAAGVSVEHLMKQGDPASTILDTCAGQKADLIAMSTHGRSGLSRWMLGSVTEKVLRTSSVPLLVVRPVNVPEPKEAGRSRTQATKA